MTEAFLCIKITKKEEGKIYIWLITSVKYDWYGLFLTPRNETYYLYVSCSNQNRLISERIMYCFPVGKK
jgi:hypothetical protein